MRLGLIECGTQRPDWSDFGAFGAWFPPLLHLAGAAPEYRVWNAVEGQLPTDPGACDAYLLTGSPASAYDDAPWQQALTGFLRQVDGKVPLIGICYGHQHLHHVLGGKVTEGADWGVGIHHYDVTALPDWLPDDVASDSAQGFDLIALHKDQVTRLAPDTQVLAQSPFCPAAVTQIGDTILTFQAHPEMDPAFAATVYAYERDRIGAAQTDAATASLTQPRNPALAARWIMAFLTHTLAKSGASQ